MKILERGKTLQHRCTGHGNGKHGCEALLELECGDLRFYPGVDGDSWGSRPAAVCFKCPCCGCLTDIRKDDWPVAPAELKRWSKYWQETPPMEV